MLLKITKQIYDNLGTVHIALTSLAMTVVAVAALAQQQPFAKPLTIAQHLESVTGDSVRGLQKTSIFPPVPMLLTQAYSKRGEQIITPGQRVSFSTPEVFISDVHIQTFNNGDSEIRGIFTNKSRTRLHVYVEFDLYQGARLADYTIASEDNIEVGDSRPFQTFPVPGWNGFVLNKVNAHSMD